MTNEKASELAHKFLATIDTYISEHPEHHGTYLELPYRSWHRRLTEWISVTFERD